MSTEPTIEQRLTTLERAVANLERPMAAQPRAGNWLDRIIGSFKDEPAFDEVLEYSRAFRAGDLRDDRQMDRVEYYRAIVRRLVEEYASYKPSHGQIETEAIVDPQKDHYEVMHVGWDGHRRVHGCVVHIDIINSKVWIQYDGTNRPVAEELLAAGIPREDIVLAFHPVDVRPYTQFAVT